MELGIGLNATIPGVTRDELLEWSKRSERHGFSSLGTIDRIVYQNYEPLMALSAAAAVTERIRLATTILITPYRLNTALLAKQVATLDQISNGRVVLGVAIGARDDDYVGTGAPVEGRGRRIEDQIDEMKRIWAGEERGTAGGIGPRPKQTGGPPIIVGGHADAAIERAARLGDGWIMGGGPPEQYAEMAAKVDDAWKRNGRSGTPRKMGLTYYSLGPNARENADRYINDYYGFLGDYSQQIAQSVAINEEMVKQYLGAFEQAGCDELVAFPCATDPEQVDLLAAAANM
jgi:alkanesulfonate monooxygenase SsuD/methylene tetrahydromethanopterin reductase-like flavin-dependent oxidoreductase (luciferase family)